MIERTSAASANATAWGLEEGFGLVEVSQERR